jgi:hypothetical protein
MTNRLWTVSGFAILLMVSCAISMAAERTSSLTLPITGSDGFKGGATINRFENRGNQIVAIGVVRNSSGTAFAGVAWPVTVTAETSSLSAHNGQEQVAGQFIPVAWWPRGRHSSKLLPVQATPGCGVLNISLAPIDVNLAGVQVSLSLVSLAVTGQSGTPLGSLVCSALNLLESVAGLVNVLNRLLGSLTGAGASVTGGLVP